MREHKFRGKSKARNEWVFGYLSSHNTIAYIIGDDYDDIPVHEETIGKYTGLNDKDGEDIYEGDVLQIKIPAGGFWGVLDVRVGKLEYNEDTGGYKVEWPQENSRVQNYVAFDCDIACEADVIRTIHDEAKHG